MPTPPIQSDSRADDSSHQLDLALPSSTRGPQGQPELNAPDAYVPDWVPNALPAAQRADAPIFPKGISNEAVSAVTIAVADDEEADDPVTSAIDAAPPWLISLAVHMTLIIILGLLALSSVIAPSINLEARFNETFGEQVETETFEISDQQSEDVATLTVVDMTSTDDPLATPHTDALQMPDQLLATSSFAAPQIGLALTGREPGMKEALLLAYGGDKITEDAVAEALKWLQRNQGRDGSWRLDGPYTDGAAVTNRVAATAMALLAFQGAGFTHQSTRQMLTESGGKTEVDYRQLVRKGWKRLLDWQDSDGNFWKRGGVDHPHHKLYSHAQATIAICELYGMTQDEDFRRPAQLAVNYACAIQDDDDVSPDGGWKYDPHRDSDLSVTGWFVMALQSARMAGLDVPSDVFAKVSKFLDSVTDEGSYYAYMPGYNSKPSLTAEGLLCRQYLGWKRDDERLLQGVEYLARHPIDWNDTNTYYWYYATQVMHHMEGDAWFDWNAVMAKELPAKQVSRGPERGSWSPDGDIWGQGGGRLYMTCLCTYMLEVYYRHLPLYSKAF